MTDQPFFYPALIILLVSIPLVLGIVPRNRLYGIRTTQALSDDRSWYAVNRFGGCALAVSSLVYLAVAALAPCPTPCGSSPGMWSLHLAVFTGTLLASLLLILRHGRTL